MTKVVFPIKSGGGSKRVGLRLKRTTGYIVEKFLHVSKRRMKILAAWTGRASLVLLHTQKFILLLYEFIVLSVLIFSFQYALTLCVLTSAS